MGFRIPKALIRQFNFDQGPIEIKIEEHGILIVPVKETVPPMKEWDRLFKEAIASGFDPEEDAKDFSTWDSTINDGINDGL